MTLGRARPVALAGLVRVAPELRPGEIGCVGACPLCAPGFPPCLACRDALRARFARMEASDPVSAAAPWN